MLVNGLVVSSSDPSKVEAKTYRVPPKLLGPTEDYTQKNAVAATKRLKQLATIHKNPKATQANKPYLLSALKNEALQLADLLALLRQGRNHHAAGIAARIRLLLIPTKGRMGLLQICAAHLGREVLVFTATRPQTTIPAYARQPSSLRLSLSMSGTATTLFPTGVDIDLWLDMPGASINTKKFTAREVIAAIGNTMGAHTDPDLHPLVEHLVGVRLSGGDLLLTSIYNVGSVMLSTCEGLLATTHQG
jgi:hypothetical protein